MDRVKRNSMRDAYLSVELVEVLRQHRVELIKDQLPFHNQRSTAASVATADGASLWEVSRMLGHKDIRTTANQYGHPFPETQREMAERMGRLIQTQAPPAANEQ